MRQLRRPIAALAIAIMVLQTLVAGLATVSPRLRADDAALGIICHSNGVGHGGDNAGSGTGPGQARHDCCAFCTAAGPATLAPGETASVRLPLRATGTLIAAAFNVQPVRRAIRAGPAQAPPVVA
jgi:hypothetical protein